MYWKGNQGEVLDKLPLNKASLSPEFLDKVYQARKQMIEQIADLDDEVMEVCLEKGEQGISRFPSPLSTLSK